MPLTPVPRTDHDRVRRHTAENELRKVDEMTRTNIRHFGTQPRAAIDARIAALERRWDVERVLETNASVLALTGAVLGVTRDKRWFWLTATVLGFLTQHALQGWCPPIPVFRRLGIRTQNEIDQERYALKAIQGDFDGTSTRATAPVERTSSFNS